VIPVRLLIASLLVVVLVPVAVPAAGQAFPAWIPDVPFGVTGYIGETEKGIFDTPTRVRSWLEFAELFGTEIEGLGAVAVGPAVKAFFAEGGGTAWIVRTVDSSDGALVGFDGGVPGARTGLAALRDVDEVSAVVVPGATSIAVQTAMITHCRSLGDRIAILDGVPPGDLSSVLAQRAALGAPEGFGALYSPWVETLYQGTPRTTPPSGFVAGVYARTAPYRSPVDILGSAIGLSTAYSSGEVDLLVPDGVNPIRSFPGQGIRVWGARTLAPVGDEMLYVAVRRAVNHLRESIDEGTAFSTSEPNDATLWTQLRALVENYLTVKWADGWLAGVTTSDAFFVRCDATTMTAQDIAEGRTILLVGVALVRPAEFTIFEIVHERSGATSVTARRETGARLLAPTPNPFNPRTTLTFTLERPGPVRLEVFDLAGRFVRTVVDSPSLPAGRHERTWDGRDARGRSVASGVYSVRLRAGATNDVRRVTLVE